MRRTVQSTAPNAPEWCHTGDALPMWWPWVDFPTLIEYDQNTDAAVLMSAPKQNALERFNFLDFQQIQLQSSAEQSFFDEFAFRFSRLSTAIHLVEQTE